MTPQLWADAVLSLVCAVFSCFCAIHAYRMRRTLPASVPLLGIALVAGWLAELPVLIGSSLQKVEVEYHTKVPTLERVDFAELEVISKPVQLEGVWVAFLKNQSEFVRLQQVPERAKLGQKLKMKMLTLGHPSIENERVLIKVFE